MENDKKYTITCTKLAAQEAKKQIDIRNNPDTKGIRLKLIAGGCSGANLVIEFADKVKDTDHIFAFDDVLFYVDPKSIIYLNNTNIDYEIGLMKTGFKLDIPAQKSSCSCGTSLTFK